MPSVGSISATASRNYPNQDQVRSIVTAFPLIDPLDAFYLVNPSGDLTYTQNEFETWFRDQNMEVISWLLFLFEKELPCRKVKILIYNRSCIVGISLLPHHSINTPHTRIIAFLTNFCLKLDA